MLYPVDAAGWFSVPLCLVTTDPWLWNLFLFLLLLIAGAAGVLLYVFSSTPQNWEHTSILTQSTENKRLSEVTHLINGSVSVPSPHLKNMMKTIFLEKVRLAKGMSSHSLMFFREKDPEYLRKLIDDDELYDWLFYDQPPQEIQKKKVKRKERPQRFFQEMDMMMKKMEAWGS
jgi:hypothetical protein